MSTTSNANIDLFQEQILAAVKNKTPLSIEGGGTKSWYGNANSYAKLDTRTYAGILEYQPEELVITACAGTPLKEIEAALANKNQILAFEPPHFGESATFGGAIAAGLAGPGRISAGNLRDFVLGARILDGKGQDLSFGGKVMKNVAGYDVSRLLPGSMGTLSLLLEASVKVLPRPAATTSLRCSITQARALQLLNEWAGQPLPLSASCWIGSSVGGDGELTIRLAGAVAAVKAAIPIMGAAVNVSELDPQVAKAFWVALREQQLTVFLNLNSDETLYRLALPAACGTLAF
jgi:glycolate oxidase FAD binding subunit